MQICGFPSKKHTSLEGRNIILGKVFLDSISNSIQSTIFKSSVRTTSCIQAHEINIIFCRTLGITLRIISCKKTEVHTKCVFVCGVTSRLVKKRFGLFPAQIECCCKEKRAFFVRWILLNYRKLQITLRFYFIVYRSIALFGNFRVADQITEAFLYLLLCFQMCSLCFIFKVL